MPSGFEHVLPLAIINRNFYDVFSIVNRVFCCQYEFSTVHIQAFHYNHYAVPLAIA